MLTFQIPEFTERIRKTKLRMDAEGIEVLLVTDPANMNYLTGYNSWSFYVHQMVAIFIDEAQPYWIGRGVDASSAKITTWLDTDHIISYPDDYVNNAVKHPMDFVSDFLKDHGRANQTIATELDAYYFTAKCIKTLEKNLSNAHFKDGTLLVNWVRFIKSTQEIEYMKKAAKIVERAMGIGIDLIQEGVRESDVVAKIYEAQISGTDDFGGDYPSIVPLLPSGEKTSACHLTWTDERYKKGDPVILELAGCYRRYHSPMARTLVIGEPTPVARDLANVVIEGLNVTLDAIRPGMTCEEVEGVWRKSIAKSGFIKDSRIGYSTGLNYPPDWGEHTASLRPGDLTVLQPNMTFHMIPGIWLDNVGMEFSETFRVTENGIETFANFPRQLFIK